MLIVSLLVRYSQIIKTKISKKLVLYSSGLCFGEALDEQKTFI